MIKPKVFTASLLLAGTAIGAGMLALPVSTSEGGFGPAVLVYILCWLFSMSTGLLLLEACLWFPKGVNIISLSKSLLGNKGKWISWVLYIFLFYCLTIAYVAGGGGFIADMTDRTLSPALTILIFVTFFSPVVYLGTKAVDRVNLLLMFGLAVFFLIFVFIGFKKVNLSHLSRVDYRSAFFALPIIFTSFSYQGTVPSVRNYFEKDDKSVRKVILLGATIPLLIYILWEYLILGIIPHGGENGLFAASQKGLSGVAPLKYYVNSPFIYLVGQAFAFCALTTSFLGVTLGLFDFLADGLSIQKKGKNKIFLFFLVYFPPTIVAMLKPKIFLRALSYAGGVGCALLLGLIPVWMVWSGRYRKKLGKQPLVPGGRPVLILLILFVVFEFGLEIMNELRLILNMR